MEDRIWDLVERFLSGEASEKDIRELKQLLIQYPGIGSSVREFLLEYKDPDPQVTARQTAALFEDNSSTPTTHHNSTHTPISFFRKELLMAGQLFRMAVRNIKRNRVVSLINITGLAGGIASAVLILLWIQNQLSYDQFHEKRDRVFQVLNRSLIDGELQCWGSTPHPLAPALKAEYPQVEEAVRTNWVGAFVFKNAQKQVQTQGYLTDPGFFKLFSFPLIKGNPETALSGRRSVVLTEKLAKKLFGDTDPMGKTIRVDSTANFTVTGVLKDLPNNTIFGFEYLMPWSYMEEVGWDDPRWDSYSVETLVLLKPGVGEEEANKRFAAIYKTHKDDSRNEVFVHPMKKWWLYSKFENGKATGGRIETVKLFGIIAALILLIACINYMNLGTARSARRAKEVGIRKVAGAAKSSLVKQFLGESVLTAFVAGAIALIIVQLSLPWFSSVVGKELSLPLGDIRFWLTGTALLLFTGITAGSYPAFYLSSYRPATVLKGVFKPSTTLITPRKVLVVIQFTFAITFIICTLVIYRQIGHAQKRDTGYNMDGLVYIYMKGDIQKNYPMIRNELLNSGTVTGITRTNSPITEIWTNDDGYEWQGKDPAARPLFTKYVTDKDFTETTGLALLSGRDIDTEKYLSDSSAILLTESAAKLMNFADPIGQTVKSRESNLQVVGVIKDFVTGWPYQLAMPIVVQGAKKGFGTITARLNHDRTKGENLRKVGEVFKKYNPDYPFDYQFVDETYSLKFSDDKYTGQLAAVFSGLTIFISCLGLFALAACMAESRIKEIGIRKVLGASVARIAALLSKDFMVLVMISFLIAAPVAWWLMNSWLRTFPYHISIGWWIFALTGVLSAVIALATISYQTIRSALANPAKSLRTE